MKIIFKFVYDSLLYHPFLIHIIGEACEKTSHRYNFIITVRNITVIFHHVITSITLVGAGVTVLVGAGVTVLVGAGVIVLVGAGVTVLVGAGVTVLVGAGVTVLVGARVTIMASLIISRHSLGTSGSSWWISTQTASAIIMKNCYNNDDKSRDMTRSTKWVCAQRRLRSAWACVQSEQNLRCPHEESLGP